MNETPPFARFAREVFNWRSARSREADPSLAQFRLRCPEIFRNPALARRLERALADGKGVRQVSASDLTARIEVRYGGACDARWIRSTINAVLADSASRRSTPVQFELRAHIPSDKRSTAVRREGSAPQEGVTNWHSLRAGAVLFALDSRSDGLDQEEALRRQRLFGKNALPEPSPPKAAELFLEQFKSLPVGLLLGSATLSVATGGIIDAVVTVAVVLANAAIGYSTESAAQRSILSMTKRSSWTVRVRRGALLADIASEDVVPGDILLLRAGTVLPADARVIEADYLRMNEALLTGESEPVEKDVAPVDASAPLTDQANMVRRGTFVASGSGAAVVVAIGSETEIGRIEEAAAHVRPPPTILEQDLGRLGSQLTILAGVVCMGVFGVGLLRGRTMAGMLKSSVALAVAAVPEGLPAISTTALALELRRLKTKKVMARRLHAVEGLGALSVICFDKTGTLTENEMSVANVSLGDGAVEIDPREEAAVGAVDPDFLRLMEIGALCSDVEIDDGEQGVNLAGSGTENALVDLALRHGVDVRRLRSMRPRVDARLRDADRRMMATFHSVDEPSGGWIAAKGDPKTVLDRCGAVLVRGEARPLTGALRAKIREKTDAMAARGLRVLGFAYGEPTPSGDWFAEPLVWCGAAGLSDPLRPGTREVVADLQSAGIQTIMITGDQSATARSIAAELNLAGGGPLQILDASDVSGMPRELLSALCQETHIFARVSPAQKLDIVHALQANGAVVGMTGDGFNDAPAMKAADVAIAIGAESAGAARDVADIVIDGDHIRHIADGVAYGRTVRANVRKSVRFMLATNLSEILVILVETLLAKDEIESPLELFWLNLVTDVLPGLGLALELPEHGVMTKPPARKQRLIDNTDIGRSALESLVISGGALCAHGFGLSRYGPGPKTRAVTLFSLITGQLLHAFSCRAERFEDLPERSLFSNRTLNYGLGAAFALQALPVFFPTVRRLLGIGRMSAIDFAVAGAAGLGSFGVIQGAKLIGSAPRSPTNMEESGTHA